MLREGFNWAIIAVDKRKLGKEWLGYTFRFIEDLENFLRANPNVDPLGEVGEFHTVVLNSPLFALNFELKVESIEEDERYWWLRFELREVEKWNLNS